MKKSTKAEAFKTENPEWNRSDVATAKAATEWLPHILDAQAAADLLKPRGRPRAEFPKERINIRLSYEVLQHFKSAGQGWQSRIDAALREHIAKLNSARRR